MTRQADHSQAASIARAIDRVLAAERDAEAALAQARQQAHATLEAARDEARLAVNAALERTAAWQRAHAAALERRLAAARDRAADLRRGRPPQPAAIAQAVAQLAARLSGGAGEAER